MSTTAHIAATHSPRTIITQVARSHDPRPSETEPPTFREILFETLPLIDVVPEAGPPVSFLAVPYLIFVVMLIGPFALLVTMVILFVAATALVALACAIVATPYLLVRRHRGHRATHASHPPQRARMTSQATRPPKPIPVKPKSETA